MTIGEVADGCERAVEKIKEAMAQVTSARELNGKARAGFHETLGEASTRHDAIVSPLDRTDEALEQALDSALAAVEDVESYVAFIMGTSVGGSASSGDRPARRFDPHTEPGALGTDFRPGLHKLLGSPDPFEEHEVYLADYLVQTEGVDIRQRPIVKNEKKVKNPDVMIRTGPNDLGRYAEFKTLNQPTSEAVKSRIRDGSRQLKPYGGGDLYIDGRAVNLDEQTARRGFARYVGQARPRGSYIPERVRMILADGRILTFEEGQT